MAAVPNLPGIPNPGILQILPADTTTIKLLHTPGAAGGKATAIWCASSDTSAKIVQLYRTRGGVDYLFSSTTVPAGSGTDAAGVLPTVNLLLICVGLPVDNDGQPYLFEKVGDTLRAGVTTTITAGKVINIFVEAADF